MRKIREIKLNERHVEDKWLSSVWKQKGRGWKNQTVMYEPASHPIIFGDNSQSTGIHRRPHRLSILRRYWFLASLIPLFFRVAFTLVFALTLPINAPSFDAANLLKLSGDFWCVFSYVTAFHLKFHAGATHLWLYFFLMPRPYFESIDPFETGKDSRLAINRFIDDPSSSV